ncbi:AMP-binding protein [Brevibacterium daeguense]|nr:AMP-binding protein [Brevibacterium daeguense]
MMTSVPTDHLLDLSRSVSMTGKLLRHAHEIPDQHAVVFRGDGITWSTYADLVLRMAQHLRDRGVGRGDRVAVVLTNRPEFLVVTAAADAIGAIIVPVNFRLTGSEIAYIVDMVDPVVLFTESGTHQLAVHALGETTSQPALVDCDEVDLLTPSSYPAGPLEVSDIVIPDPHDDFVILHTSGTTGHPKGAVLSNLTVFSAAVQNAARWGANSDSGVIMLAPPLFHIGSFASSQAALAGGAAALVIPSAGFDPEQALHNMKTSAVTAAFMVPQQWSLICDIIERTGSEGLAITHASWGGAPATEKLLTRMAACMPDAEITAVFGQTETTGTAVSLPFADSLRKIGSVGKPTAETSVRIVDGDMNDVGVDEVGEIVYRGPCVMSRYWNNPEATAEAFHGGWFHSGDLVRRDSEGFIYVVDRLKDMIISGGENIYCAEIENVLAWHPEVVEVSVVGRPDEKWGEVPVACIVPKDPENPPSLDDVRAFLGDKLAKYKHPKELQVFDVLPRSGMGKILKTNLRESVR